MFYFNEGMFWSSNKGDLLSLVEILNDAELIPYGFDPDDVYPRNGRFYLELPGCQGDLEYRLRNVAEKCIEKKLNVEFDIYFFGDAEGSYTFYDGKYEIIAEDEFVVRKLDDKVLLKEIYRRGLTQRICNDAIRDFMRSELENTYGMELSDAKKAAVIAFNYYTDREGATQCDGIEHAANIYKRDALVPISRESLPEYWEDFAIDILFSDGSDALAQENGYTLYDCQHKFLDAKFFLD